MHISSPLGGGMSLLPRQFNNASVCQTAGCNYYSSILNNSVNLNLDPCDDFYMYVCGNWEANIEIPPSEQSVGTVYSIMNRNTDTLGEVLSGSFDDFVKRVTKESPDGLTLMAGQEDVDRDNFNTMKNFFDSCMNLDAIDREGVKPLFRDISDLLDDLSYHTCTDDTPYDGNDITRFTDALIHLNEKGVKAFVNPMIRSRFENASESLILLDDPHFVLTQERTPLFALYEKNKTMTEYHEIITKLIKSAMGKSIDNSESEKQREADMKLFRIPQLSDEEASEMALTFVDFERKMANLTLKKPSDPPAMLEDWPLEKVNKVYPIVDWNRYINHFTPKESPQIQNLTTKFSGTLVNLGNWLTSSSNSTVSQNGTNIDNATPTFRKITQYLVVKLIIQQFKALPEPIFSNGERIMGKLVQGSSEKMSRRRMCVSGTTQVFKDVMGRFFAILKFGGEPQRLKARKLISGLIEAWRMSLQNSDWLDQETFAAVIEKLDKLKHAEGYSIISPDQRNATLLKELISSATFTPNTFYENLNQGAKLETASQWKGAGLPIDKDKWLMPPFDVNAYYMPSLNNIVVPAGIMQVPFYDWELPDYLNYGGIGSAIGHEITHAFDSTGRSFDGDGIYRNWWTEEATNKFFEKAQCFHDQYERFSIEGTDGERIGINGMRTLGENLADNGGLRASWLAYKQASKSSTKPSLRIPNFESFTPDQLFFMNFANAHCGKSRIEALTAQVLSDSHAPGNVRAVTALRNTKEFAEAFNCPLGSRMNPEEKCQIW